MRSKLTIPSVPAMAPSFLLRAALTLVFASTSTVALFYKDNAELATAGRIRTNESQTQNIHASTFVSSEAIVETETNARTLSNTTSRSHRHPIWAGNEPYPLCSCWHTGAPLEDIDDEDDEEGNEVNMGYVT